MNLPVLPKAALILMAALFISTNSGHAAVILGTIELDGSQQVPSNASVLTGTGSFSYNSESPRLSLLINFIGDIDLDGNQTPGNALDDVTGIHIHHAAAGANGPIVFSILSETDTADTIVNAPNKQIFSVWDSGKGAGTTLEDQISNLESNNLYINVHTVGYPAGEIRGQITMAHMPEPTTGLLSLLGCSVLLLRRRRV